MRFLYNYLGVGLLYLLINCTAYSQNQGISTSGEWKGILHHPGDGYSDRWQILMTLTQVNKEISGTIKFSSGEHYGIFVIAGSLANNQVVLESGKLLKESLSHSFSWCPSGIMRLKLVDANKLTGPFTYSGTCPPATVTVSREVEPSNTPVVQPRELLSTDNTGANSGGEDAKVDKPIVLKNVLFKHQTAILLPNSTSELNDLVSKMKANSKMMIRLEGHTDKTGPASKNLILSQDRVKVVKQHLITKGINHVRVATVGYGDTKPICVSPCEANRRVEFVVTQQ